MQQGVRLVAAGTHHHLPAAAHIKAKQIPLAASGMLKEHSHPPLLQLLTRKVEG
jgi:hypothetical protein